MGLLAIDPLGIRGEASRAQVKVCARLRAYPNRSVFEVGCEVDERKPRSRGLARETSARRQNVHLGKREEIMSEDPQGFLMRIVVVLVCALGRFGFRDWAV